LLILGCIALFSGIEGVVKQQPLKPNIAADILEKGWGDFQKKKYRQALIKGRLLVRSDPKAVEAWKLLASVWWTIGEKRQAQQAYATIMRLKPGLFLDNEPILQLIEKSAAAPK